MSDVYHCSDRICHYEEAYLRACPQYECDDPADDPCRLENCRETLLPSRLCEFAVCEHFEPTLITSTAAGLIAGGVVLAFALGAGFFWWWIRRRNRRQNYSPIPPSAAHSVFENVSLDDPVVQYDPHEAAVTILRNSSFSYTRQQEAAQSSSTSDHQPSAPSLEELNKVKHLI